MKRATAIGPLVEMAEAASEHLRLRESEMGWPLKELWVDGELLRVADTMESGPVVLMLELPAEW